MSTRRARRLASAASVLIGLSATMALSPPAWAAPPPNDNRADAILIRPPGTVNGTLVDATLEATHDVSVCGDTDGSVWYHFKAPARGAVVLQLDAGGEMDSTIDLFKQVRSKLTLVGCSETDSDGNATVDTDGLDAGADYAIRVANETGSVADTFKLRVLIPTAPPKPPGRHLPRRGVRNHVDRVLNPGDAYWMKMRAGHTMRLSLRTRHCTSLEVFPPGTRDFTAALPERRLPCGGFGLFTPSESGRHFLVVRAARDRDVQHYRLRVAAAGPDDTTPGVLIHNHAKIRGSVNGGIDSRDLFRFDVTRSSALTLAVTGTPTMRLVRDDGELVGSGPFVNRHVRAGRYYVAVSGQGHYRLTLALRTITTAGLLINGRHVAVIRPRGAARLWLRVRPAVAGRGLVTLQRLDPIDGWQFLRSYRPAVSRGSARILFRPPSVGRYRAVAEYLGTRDAAPCVTGLAHLVVQRPLGQ